ncbi:MAG TPA: nickel pincer cofactor biosynthesis protein LarC [Gemmatimonadaceae bacterium]|nr:nickel pincer cofactor biosynthesis protein LarC [Gemmatimonadaceae bacterium]
MKTAILDPFSGIAGDMTLGALVAVGLDPEWLRALPSRLGLDGVTVQIRDVERAHIACTKVDFEIPPQPHGRHLRQIRELVATADVPPRVRELADATFTAIATVEAAIHGVTIEQVHLHEVGAVDAILDVVGSIWGFELLGVERVYCGPISLGDGSVRAAHGDLPVPAPATMRLLEGHVVRPGPPGSGELVTPTGAALVRTLSAGGLPSEYTPLRSGFGAGTKELAGRANALRMIIADVALHQNEVEQLVVLTADIDDMTGEYLSGVADRLRAAGALDVVVLATVMKKGRPGMRVEVLASPARAGTLEAMLLNESTTIGVRRAGVERRALPRVSVRVEVLGHPITVKVVRLPAGHRRAKPEFADVAAVAEATGRPLADIFRLATEAAEQVEFPGV